MPDTLRRLFFGMTAQSIRSRRAERRLEEGVAQLDPNDVVIAYTDGVIEAENQSGEEWGVHGLLNAAAARARQGDENAEQLVRLILNSMDDFTQGYQMDDATLAVLRVL